MNKFELYLESELLKLLMNSVEISLVFSWIVVLFCSRGCFRAFFKLMNFSFSGNSRSSVRHHTTTEEIFPEKGTTITNMQTYILTYVQTYKHTCIYTCTNINAYIHTYIYTNIPVFIQTYTHACSSDMFTVNLNGILFYCIKLHSCGVKQKRDKKPFRNAK